MASPGGQTLRKATIPHVSCRTRRSYAAPVRPPVASARKAERPPVAGSSSVRSRDEDAVVARAAFPVQAARAVTFIPRALITLRKLESFGSPSGVSAL